MADKLPLLIKELDFDVLKGKSYQLVMTYAPKNGTPYDLTNFKARFKARINIDDVDTVINLDETNGITLGNTESNIIIIIPGVDTADLTEDAIRYGFEIEDAVTVVTPLLTGDIGLIVSIV